MRATVLKGGWFYGPSLLKVGDVVEAPESQVAAWEADGYVERIAKPRPKPKKAEVETAEAEPPKENAAKRTSRPRKRKG